MRPWLRLTLVAMTVGGGFTGVALTLQFLLSPSGRQPANFILISAFLVLFAFVTGSGLLFVHNPRRTSPLIVATVFQIPWVSSPLVAYKFAAGFQVSIALIGGRFHGALRLGSDFQINFFQRLPWGAGINLFALLILVLLVRSLHPPIAPAGGNGTAQELTPEPCQPAALEKTDQGSSNAAAAERKGACTAIVATRTVQAV